MFFVVPNLTGLYYSVTDLSTYSDKVKFIGFENFARPNREGFLVTAIQNTFIYAICVTVFVNFFGIALALLLNEAPVLGNLYRTAFSPRTLSLPSSWGTCSQRFTSPKWESSTRPSLARPRFPCHGLAE